jgi:hypothetical protein
MSDHEINKPSSPTPLQTYKYATLMETSGEECESWYYFIKYDGNKENLINLNEQLETVEWEILDDLSTFDLELEYLVSEQTAKEMTKIDMNHTAHHRKFDGVLKPVNLGFKKKTSNIKKMTKVFDVLGYGQIEDYVDEEDVDEEDLTDASEEDSEEESEDDSVEESEEDSKKEPISRKKGIPPAITNTLPRFAMAKRHTRHARHTRQSKIKTSINV